MKRINHLTFRDLKLLELVDSYGILSTSQIQKLLFAKISKRTMLRRLARLKNKNFLQRFDGLPRGEFIWTLTNKATKHVGTDLLIKSLNKNTLAHDMIINDVRTTLDEHSVFSFWTSGHLLKQLASKNKEPGERNEDTVPDSLFQLKTPNGTKTVALEVELIAKSKRRYQRIGELYDRKNIIDYLWYLVPTKTLGAKVLDQVKSSDIFAREKEWVMWSLVEDVKLNSIDSILNFKKVSLSIKSFSSYQTGIGQSEMMKWQSKKLKA